MFVFGSVIYEGIKGNDKSQIFWNSVGLAFDIAPFVLKGSPKATEIFYRTMSESDFKVFENTGKIPSSSETFISPTQAFSEGYEGVLVQINAKAGTLNQLLKMGVRDPAHLLTEPLQLPSVQKGWTSTSAFFKQEGSQINIGLGKGKALETFNKNITSYNVIRR